MKYNENSRFQPMNTPKKTSWPITIRWVGTVLSLALLVWLLSKAGLRETWQVARQLSAWRLLAVVGLVFVSRVATFLRWNTLLSVENARVGWRESLKLTFAGLFSSNFLPTTIGGDVVRLAGAIRLNLDASLAAASLVADRLVGMTGMVLVLPFAIPGALAYRRDRPAGNGLAPAWTSASVIGVAWQKLKDAFVKVFSNFRFWIKHPLILLQALGFTLVHQLALYLIIRLLIEGMGYHLPLTQIAGIWSLTYFISLIPISINGLGLQELTITNLYSVLGGLPTSATISLAVILRALFLIASLPGAFFVPAILAGRDVSKLNPEA